MSRTSMTLHTSELTTEEVNAYAEWLARRHNATVTATGVGIAPSSTERLRAASITFGPYNQARASWLAASINIALMEGGSAPVRVHGSARKVTTVEDGRTTYKTTVWVRRLDKVTCS